MKNLKVFIAGSRHLSKLSREVTRRIDNIIAQRLSVVVGDANGIDKAVQKYLSTKHYKDVLVFCMEGGCRNNVGNWPIRAVNAANPNRHDFAYYSTKDRVMVDEADYGLMLWDAQSRGTLTSIVNLVRDRKPVVVYVAPDKSFHTLRNSEDLTSMLRRFDPIALKQVNHELHVVNRHTRNLDTAPLF